MLNIGDTVKIINNNNNTSPHKERMDLYIGKIGTITEIHYEDNGEPYYCVETINKYGWECWWWLNENLEKGYLAWVKYDD